MNHMLAAAVAVTLTAAASSAQADAPQWSLVADAASMAAYVDRASVRDSEGAKAVWVLRNYDEALNLGLDPLTGTAWYPHRSVKVLYTVDCGSGRIAMRAWEMYSGNFADGEVVWADKYHSVPNYSAAAAQEESAAIDAACGTKTALR